MYLKKLILTVLSASVASGVVVTSNQHFDRIENPNWGTEVTFYGLGLNFSWPINFTKMMLQTIAECKRIFRVVPSCKSAFAQKQRNGLVLCTYFQQPIYALPTVRADRNTALAFYKEIPVVSNNLTTNALLANGKFYLYKGVQPMSGINQTCRDNFPNGIQIRPKTKEDFDLFFNNPQIKMARQNSYLGLDLKFTNDSKPVIIWGDRTPFLSTEVASLFKLNYVSDLPYFRVYHDLNNYLYTGVTNSTAVATCEVNPF